MNDEQTPAQDQPTAPVPQTVQSPVASEASPPQVPQGASIDQHPKEVQPKQNNKIRVTSAIVIVLLLTIVAVVMMLKKPAHTPQSVETAPMASTQAQATVSATSAETLQLSPGEDDKSLENDLRSLEQAQSTIAKEQKDLEEDLSGEDNPATL